MGLRSGNDLGHIRLGASAQTLGLRRRARRGRGGVGGKGEQGQRGQEERWERGGEERRGEGERGGGEDWPDYLRFVTFVLRERRLVVVWTRKEEDYASVCLP